MIIAGCQRWRERRESYVPARELFNPRAHEVAPLAQDLAKAFVEANHYSGSCSARTRQFGLYSGSDLVGVAVFGEPGGPKVKAILPCPAAQTLELGRLVLLEGVLANAESWFVARCFDQLRRAGYGGVISFADPLPRTTIAGKVVFGGHAGTIYQSLNAVYTGHGSRDTQYLLPDGRTFNKRAASKIRKRETGWRYAVEQLVVAGAREPAEGEDLAAWLKIQRRRVTRTRSHPGCFRYLFPLDSLAGARACRAKPLSWTRSAATRPTWRGSCASATRSPPTSRSSKARSRPRWRLWAILRRTSRRRSPGW